MKKALLVLLVASAALALFLIPTLRAEAMTAQGQVTVSGSSGKVIFQSAATDDPPGRADPGSGADVGRCTVRLVNKTSLNITVQNAYPGYRCTVRAVVVNGNRFAIRLERMVVHSPDGLLVTAGRTPRSIQPGGRGVHELVVQVGQGVKMQGKYRFQLKLLFVKKD